MEIEDGSGAPCSIDPSVRLTFVGERRVIPLWTIRNVAAAGLIPIKARRPREKLGLMRTPSLVDPSAASGTGGSVRVKHGMRSKLLFVADDIAAIVTFGSSRDCAASRQHFDTASIRYVFLVVRCIRTSANSSGNPYVFRGIHSSVGAALKCTQVQLTQP